MNEDIDNNARIDDLMIRFLDRQTTAEEEEELRVWASQSEENKRYIAEIQYIWSTVAIQDKVPFESESAFQRFKARIAVQQAAKNDSRKMKPSPFFWWAAIFILAIILGGFGFYIFSNYLNQNNKNQIIIRVPKGDKTKITLPDKSTAWLNSSSTLRYNKNFGRNGRQVWMVGEGYFEISKNAEEPFVVHTSQTSVEARGTKFNITAYDDSNHVEVTLIKGSLLLKTIFQSKAFILQPNQKAIIDKKGQKVTVKKVLASESVKWIIGRF